MTHIKWINGRPLPMFDPNANPNVPIDMPKTSQTQISINNGAPTVRVPVQRRPQTTSTTTTTISNCTFVSSSPGTGSPAINMSSTGTATLGSDWHRDSYDSRYDPRYDTYNVKEITLEDIERALRSGLIDMQMSGHCQISPGAHLTLPDGSKIKVEHSGNFTIDDSKAKVTYKGNRNREFNPYINASDLLEDFIKDLGKVGVRQGQVLNVPVEAFINWLIHKAAERDGDDPPEDIKLLENERHPKCKQCGKFISKSLPAQFCNGDHYQQYIERNNNDRLFTYA